MEVCYGRRGRIPSQTLPCNSGSHCRTLQKRHWTATSNIKNAHQVEPGWPDDTSADRAAAPKVRRLPSSSRTKATRNVAVQVQCPNTHQHRKVQRDNPSTRMHNTKREFRSRSLLNTYKMGGHSRKPREHNHTTATLDSTGVRDRGSQGTTTMERSGYAT